MENQIREERKSIGHRMEGRNIYIGNRMENQFIEERKRNRSPEGNKTAESVNGRKI